MMRSRHNLCLMLVVPIPVTVIASIIWGVERIEINTATDEKLSALPGIGEVELKQIKRSRPYQNVEGLKEKFANSKVYDNIKRGPRKLGQYVKW